MNHQSSRGSKESVICCSQPSSSPSSSWRMCTRNPDVDMQPASVDVFPNIEIFVCYSRWRSFAVLSMKKSQWRVILRFFLSLSSHWWSSPLEEKQGDGRSKCTILFCFPSTPVLYWCFALNMTRKGIGNRAHLFLLLDNCSVTRCRQIKIRNHRHQRRLPSVSAFLLIRSLYGFVTSSSLSFTLRSG